MQPFQPADIPSEYKSVEAYMNTFRVDRATAEHYRDLMMKEKFFVNDKYQVNTSRCATPFGVIVHLSIKRLDKEPVRDWADMQKIKNELVGAENEGMEIFPAESRLVDMANQYHLWVFEDPNFRIPIGWQERMIMSEVEAASYGAKQRRAG